MAVWRPKIKSRGVQGRVPKSVLRQVEMGTVSNAKSHGSLQIKSREYHNPQRATVLRTRQEGRDAGQARRALLQQGFRSGQGFRFRGLAGQVDGPA